MLKETQELTKMPSKLLNIHKISSCVSFLLKIGKEGFYIPHVSSYFF